MVVLEVGVVAGLEVGVVVLEVGVVPRLALLVLRLVVRVLEEGDAALPRL